LTDRIQNLLDMGKLVHEPAPDNEVAGLWSNALQAFQDAHVPEMSASGRLVRAYDAGRIAAMAILRSRDLRPRASNHHEITISAAQGLAADELRKALGGLDVLRPLRAEAEYGWQVRTSAGDAERAMKVARQVLEHGARNLREHRPTLENRIQPPA
jgi:hypothetical protein